MTQQTMTFNELRSSDWQGLAQRLRRDVRNIPTVSATNETEVIVKIAALAYYMQNEDPRGWRCQTAAEDWEDIKKLQGLIQRSTLDDDIKQELLPFADTYWSQIWNCVHSYPIQRNKAIALFYYSMSNAEYTTVPAICSLATALLNVQRDDVVADVGSGYGTFLLAVNAQTPVAAWGIDCDRTANSISRIRNWLLQTDVEFQVGNVLDQSCMKQRADKVFSQAPLIVQQEGKPVYGEALERYLKDVPAGAQLNWAFILAAMQAQKEGGKTVVVVPSNLLAKASKGEVHIRQKLMHEGRVEAVIKLPARVAFPYGMSLSIIIFSQGNQGVRMVDATAFGKKERNRVSLSTQDIEDIATLARHDGPQSRLVTPVEMMNQHDVWVPERYIILPEDQVVNGKPLEALQVNILRGHTIRAEELAQLLTTEESPYGYLMLQNMEDSQIVAMNYLKEIKAEYGRYMVQEGDLLFSRSMPFKMAVVPNLEGKQVMASGNMYAIRLRQDLVNPVYVMLYLLSPQGERQLQRLAQGSVLQSISLMDLKKIQIPLIPLAEQDNIVASYRTLREQLDEVKEQEKSLRQQIQRLISQ